MHDLLSGVFVYDIKELLTEGIKNKLFTLQDFNRAKNSFDYGSKEKEYKIIDSIETNGKYSIQCHSRVMLCLVKYLPFILKQILPEESDLYKFGLLMEDLQDSCLKATFTQNQIYKI